MKRIIIIGSRRRDSYEDFLSTKCVFLTIYKEGDMIVSGRCPKGGDKFAEVLIDMYDTPKKIFRAKWKKDGKYNRYAGFERNTLIAKYGTVLIACVAKDRKGGTEDTIRKFKRFHPKGSVHLC